jgi:hypothetical protein
MIKACGATPCNSEYQDRVYGKGKRVMNELAGTNKGRHRCTVCGKETAMGAGKKKGK